MSRRKPNEAGETLVEIIIAIVLIGLIVGAFLATITTTTTATKTQRDLVTADGLLRNYAETAKQSARTTCTSGNTGAAIPVTLIPAPPTGFSVSATGLTCPAPTTVSVVQITATLPSGATKVLTINVRTSR